jgi:hypothetical protein
LLHTELSAPLKSLTENWGILMMVYGSDILYGAIVRGVLAIAHSSEKPAEKVDQIDLFLEHDSWGFGWTDKAVDHWCVVGKAPEWGKNTGIGLVTVQTQASGDVEGELMAAMWNATA